jgi:hypothetical protein
VFLADIFGFDVKLARHRLHVREEQQLWRRRRRANAADTATANPAAGRRSVLSRQK